MHGEPALWGASPSASPGWRWRRCGRRSRRVRRPSNSSTAGRARCRPTSTRASRCRPPRRLRRHRRPRGAHHSLRRRHRRAPGQMAAAAPMSSVSTGGCPSTRLAAGWARGTPCRAISTPRLPGAVDSGRRCRPRGARRADDGTGTGHIFNLGHGVLPETDPAILAAVVELVHRRPPEGDTASSSWRTALRPAPTRSAPSTRGSVAAGRPSPSSWRSWRAATGRSEVCPRWRSEPAAQVDAVRAVLERREPGRYVVPSAPSTPSRSSKKPRRRSPPPAARRVIGLVLTPHASSMGSQEYLDRAAKELGSTPFVAVGPGTPNPASSSPGRPGHAAPRQGDGPRHASSSPRTRYPSACARPVTPIPSS